MIVDATTPADVRHAVTAARELDLPVAVYATGHGGPAPDAETAVVIRTAGMGGVHVDPGRRTALVRAGARWADVIAAAAPYGLAPLSGTHPTVGVVGYTLGGGLSWLSRRYGFAADSVLRAQIITADGVSRTVSVEQEPDLFWAIRGGGANFGVVTALEFRLYPAGTVYAGSAAFPLDRAADVLAHYRDHAGAMPAELTANVVLTGDAVRIRGMYAGPAEGARRALAPLLRAAGTPVEDGWRTMSYAESDTLGGIAPRRFGLHATLPDSVVAAAIEAVRGGADAVEFRQWGGAMARTDAGPVGHRGVPFSIAVDGPPVGPVEDNATGGTFLNFLSDPAGTHTAYTAEDLARLRAVKTAHDPANVFRPAKNIAPVAAGLVGAH